MIGDKSMLQNGTSVDDAGKVQLPTGESANISHIGNCQLSRGNFIKNVLCVPTFKFNLLSMSKLTKELQCCAVFFLDFCLFQDLSSGKVREIGKEQDGLYVMHSKRGKGNTTQHKSLAIQKEVDATLWHRRMGHAPMSVLRRITAFQNKSCFIIDKCDICPLSRQTRVPFLVSVTKSSQLFGLLHVEVWGPYKTATYDGMQYFLTVVDDHSR